MKKHMSSKEYSAKKIDERKKLYKNFKDLKLINKEGLFFSQKNHYHAEINHLINFYLSENINFFFKKKYLNINKSIKLINKLPNLTPNGILKPIKSTQLIYNLITKFLLKSLSHLSIKFDSTSFPAIRIRSNKFNSKRAYSTTKLHSDAWVGQYGDAVISFGIEGDFDNNGVKFYLPRLVSKDFFNKTDDYNSGMDKFKGLKYIGKLKKGFFCIFDQSILHKTDAKKKCKSRISIDFVIKIKNNIKTTISGGDTQRYNYMSINKFDAIGSKSLIVATENSDYKKTFQKFVSI